MEKTDIELMSNLIEAHTKLEVEYIDNIAINTINYFKIIDNNILELVLDVKIEKFVFLGYFNNY